jgi:DNA repair protein RadC
MYSIPVYRVSLVKESSIKMSEESFRSPLDLAKVLSKYFHGLDREHFVVVALNSRNRIIGINTVSIGSLDQSIVHPRETFKAAILCNAAAIVLAHNHPGGSTQPSRDDREVTARLKNAGELLGIKVLDHIIMGEGLDYFSFTAEEAKTQDEERLKDKNEALKRAQKRLLAGRATGEDMVYIARYRMAGIFNLKTAEMALELEDIIKSLTSITERQRGPSRTKREAADLISTAKSSIELISKNKAA